jgi:5-methylcytosine-specific restriction endonuclease McrA
MRNDLPRKIAQALSLELQVQDLTVKINQAIAELKADLAPRRRFQRWISTQEGIEWKKGQFHKQRCCCDNCLKEIDFKFSHVDHVKPLAKYPDLAIYPSNLRILCANCNIRKGSR